MCSNCCGTGCYRCQPAPTGVTTGPPVATVPWIDDARRRLRDLEANPTAVNRNMRARLREQIAEYEDAQHARAEHETECA